MQLPKKTLKIFRHTNRAPSKGVVAEEPVAPKPVVIEYNLDDLEEPDSQDINFNHNFEPPAFLLKWEEKAATLLGSLQEATSSGYAFLDAISFLEESLRTSKIDASANLLDSALTKEIESLLRIKTIFLLVEHLFSERDAMDVKQFILTPKNSKGPSGVSADRLKKDDWIKELAEMKSKTKEQLKSLLDEVYVGVKRSRKNSA